jgi:hypothetical protein
MGYHMSKLDPTKPVRCFHRCLGTLKTEIIYINNEIIVAIVDSYSEAVTWNRDSLKCISSPSLGPLENYEKPVKVKKVVYLHSREKGDDYYVSVYSHDLERNEAIASVEVEFTIGKFAE